MKRLIGQHLRHGVIVTLKTGDSFQGVLFAADSEAFVLRAAAQLDPGGRNAPAGVDGELLILRPDVAYLQFV